MRYDPTKPEHMRKLLDDTRCFGDDCPVDDICDSIPAILDYIRHLEGIVRGNKSIIQRLEAEKKDLERRLNNTKSQKFRLAKKKGKTLHN